MVVPNMPYEDYAKTPGVNASILKTVHKFSLAHAKAQLDGLVEKESDALDFGTAFHSLLLEGRADYVIQPESYTNDKGELKPWHNGANACKAWVSEQNGKTVLTTGEAKGLEAMVSAARSHRGLAGVLNGQCELSVFAEKDGIPVKARVDLLPDDSRIVIDFKSAKSAEPTKFMRQCLDLGYHIQCAWLLDVLSAAGIKRDEVWMVGIEQDAPNAICILKFKDTPLSFLRLGRIHARAAFRKLRTAHESGFWPDYGATDAEEHTPAWMLKELEQTA